MKRFLLLMLFAMVVLPLIAPDAADAFGRRTRVQSRSTVSTVRSRTFAPQAAVSSSCDAAQRADSSQGEIIEDIAPLPSSPAETSVQVPTGAPTGAPAASPVNLAINVDGEAIPLNEFIDKWYRPGWESFPATADVRAHLVNDHRVAGIEDVDEATLRKLHTAIVMYEVGTGKITPEPLPTSSAVRAAQSPVPQAAIQTTTRTKQRRVRAK